MLRNTINKGNIFNDSSDPTEANINANEEDLE